VWLEWCVVGLCDVLLVFLVSIIGIIWKGVALHHFNSHFSCNVLWVFYNVNFLKITHTAALPRRWYLFCVYTTFTVYCCFLPFSHIIQYSVYARHQHSNLVWVGVTGRLDSYRSSDILVIICSEIPPGKLLDQRKWRMMPPPYLEIYLWPRVTLTFDLHLASKVERFMLSSHWPAVPIGVKIVLMILHTHKYAI